MKQLQKEEEKFAINFMSKLNTIRMEIQKCDLDESNKQEITNKLFIEMKIKIDQCVLKKLKNSKHDFDNFRNRSISV